MKHAEKIALENALQTHYQEIRRTEIQPSDQARQALLAQLAAQTAEQERERSRFPTREPAPQGTAFDFVMTAARFLPWQLWGAPAAAVLVAALAAAHGLSSSQILVTLSGLGPALAIACLYGITRARSHGMAEIEAACSHGSIALASARLTLLCGASFAAIAAACALCSDIVPAFAAATVALAPYLLASAGGLLVARKVAAHNAALASLAWAAGVLAACFVLSAACPAAFGQAAIWIWAAVAACSALWFAREALLWVSPFPPAIIANAQEALWN